MPEETTDANTEQESSTSSDANGGESSTLEKKPGDSMADVLARTMAKSLKDNPAPEKDEEQEEKTEGDEDKSSSTIEEDNKKPEEGEKSDDEVEEETEEDKSTEKTKAEKEKDAENERWDKHPRSQEYLTKIRDLEPHAEFGQAVTNFAKANKVTPERLDQALEVAALIETNPQKAFELLTPIYESLATTLGAKGELPKELAEQVAAGEMTEKVAREIHRLRKGGEINTQLTQRQQQEQQVTQYQNTMRSWVSDKQRIDPAYKPKGDATKPDGLFEMVETKFTALCAMNPPKNLSDSIKRAEDAYISVKATFKAQQPLPPKRKVMRSNGANRGGGSAGSASTPKSLADVIKQSYERHSSN